MSSTKEELSRQISERLRLMRERMGQTQAEFALLAGVTGRAQRNYEAGDRVPNLTYLAKLARAGVDVEYILTGEDAASRWQVNVDGALLGQIIEAVEKQGGADILPAKRGQVIAFLYQSFQVEHAVDLEYVSDIVAFSKP